MMHGKMFITTLLLAGWYLMLPPPGQRNGIPWPDNKAPFARWTTAKSFDTAKGCEVELANNRKHFAQSYKRIGQTDPQTAFWSRFYVTAAGEATCIASDDVRLKETVGEASPDLKQSTAVQPPGN